MSHPTLHRLRFLAFALFLPLIGLYGADTRVKPGYLAGALRKDEPQAIYSENPLDPWNRIFHCLFTRTLQVRLSPDFPEGAPFSENIQGATVRTASSTTFERIESGDRAIEPMYPHEHFRTDVSTAQLLDEPRFSRLQNALTDARGERTPRTPLARALMQSDLWAAYDFLARDVSSRILKDAPIALFHERQTKLRKLLAPLVRQIALTSDEIKALPDNYVASGSKLPEVFAANSEWAEVLWNPEREHERASGYRRAARVFIRPLGKPANKLEFLRGGNRSGFHEHVEATALVIQNLLVDTTGNVVPSPLTHSVQVRTLHGGAVAQRFEEFELNRQELLKHPGRGGLIDVTGLPAYLPGAGNDYSYASPIGGTPVAVQASTHCTSCHLGNPLFTLGIPSWQNAPEIRLLVAAENDHAYSVARTKMKTESFKRLLSEWK